MSNRKNDSDKRTIWISSRYTPDEYKRVKKMAKSIGMAVSKYVRESALNNVDTSNKCPLSMGTYPKFKAHISEILSGDLYQTDAGKQMIIGIKKASAQAGTKNETYAINVLKDKFLPYLNAIESEFKNDYFIEFVTLDILISYLMKYEKSRARDD